MTVEFGLRSYEWRDVSVVVLRGDVDLDAAGELSRTLARLQRDATVFVDLWDITSMEQLVVEILATAAARAEETRWEFAIIAPPGGVAAQEIEAAGLEQTLTPFATKQDARAALRLP